ncbi:MAG: NADH-quinone oxidoreductase subunit C [Planctomycetota bacterium]
MTSDSAGEREPREEKQEGPIPAGVEEHPVVAALPEECRGNLIAVRNFAGQTAIEVARPHQRPILEHLRESQGFDVLVDVTAVDYLNQDVPERFQVVHIVQRRSDSLYLRVHTWVAEENPSIESVYDLWPAASWGERECHDMFGIVFEGNPDLRRFLMPEDYPAFPLLKDYPLKGRGERVQFPRIVPRGDEMQVEEPLPYPTSIGRGMHTPEYLEEIERDSKPRS